MKQNILILGTAIALFVLVFSSGFLAVSASSFQDDKELETKYETEHYNVNFSAMVDKQMEMDPLPQTDSDNDWYDASEALTQYYTNPKNFDKDSSEYFQFMKLSSSSEISTDQLNDEILQGKGELEGKAKEFKQASEKQDVNEIYLISHALHETGEGSSKLAEGVEVGENKKGKPTLVTSSNRSKLDNIKTVYNFFGIKADDDNALEHGAKHAYKQKWNTPEDAIVGGANYIAQDYIAKGQDTLYKMRWNPENSGSNQYATDVGWAVKQTNNIKRVYDMLQDVDGVVLTFEVPEFNNQPKPADKPKGANVFHVDQESGNAGKKGNVKKKSHHLRKGPTPQFSDVTKLSKGTQVTIIGENADWYKVKNDKQKGWISADNIQMKET